MQGVVSFRPLTRDDFGQVLGWLTTPHVQEWWRGEPTTLKEVERKYGPVVDGDEPTQAHLIELGGAAVGIIQCYRVADYPEWDRVIGIPASAGIDYLVGEPSLVGRGVGSAAIAAFVPHVFGQYPDVAVIVVTPQAANPASRRVLEKAGFEFVAERQLDSDDPSDAGVSAIYILARPVG